MTSDLVSLVARRAAIIRIDAAYRLSVRTAAASPWVRPFPPRLPPGAASCRSVASQLPLRSPASLKRDICLNAIDLAKVLRFDEARVAILSAVENITRKLPSTLEAAALRKMADRRQISGGLVDGPLKFDDAVSAGAARQAHIVSPVAGKANILLVPDIESGNMLVKQLTFMSGAEGAGIVLGARVPIILTSDADKLRTRLASAATAVPLAHAQRRSTAIQSAAE